MKNTSLAIVLALLTMVGPLGIDTYLPSFPAIAATFGVSSVIVQQTLSVYMAGLAVMMLFYGTLSDSFGRRPVMMISLVVFSIISVCAALAPTAGSLVIVRGLQGLSAGAGIVLSRAMIQDRFSGSDAQKMMALVTMMFGLAPAIAPIIGGVIQTTLGWRYIFFFLAAFGFIMLITSWRVLPETLPKERRQPFNFKSIAANYRKAISSPKFTLLAVAFGTIFCGLPLYVGSAASYVMGVLHKPETAFGWLFIPMVSGLVIGSALTARISHSYRPQQLVKAGMAIMVFAVVVGVIYTSLFVAQVPFATIPLMIYTFGLSIASPGMSIAVLSVFPEMRGLSASLQGFIQMMLFAAITGFVAPIVDDSALKIAVGHAILLVIGIAVWMLGNRVGPRAATASPAK